MRSDFGGRSIICEIIFIDNSCVSFIILQKSEQVFIVFIHKRFIRISAIN